MKTNRRNWLKQVGIVTAGLSIPHVNTLAYPGANVLVQDKLDNGLIRLSSNENPYGPSPSALKAMKESVNFTNRYHWNVTGDLIAAIAKKNNAINENILLGAGSTEILNLIVQSLLGRNGNFIVATPSYTNWTKTAEQVGLQKIAIELTPEKQYNLQKMLAAIQPDTRMVYICNPNNPTGVCCDHQALLSFIKEATQKTIVIIDEAYIDFTNQPSVSHLVTENKNLIVVKTFSKIHGLAGARVGYAIANTETIQKTSQVQSWANGGISLVSRYGAIASLADDTFIKECYTKNEEVRKYTIEQLTLLNVKCIFSQTNFIYFSLANYPKDYFQLLKSNGIEGTYLYEENGKWTRITVGTKSEMERFIAALK